MLCLNKVRSDRDFGRPAIEFLTMAGQIIYNRGQSKAKIKNSRCQIADRKWSPTEKTIGESHRTGFGADTPVSVGGVNALRILLNRIWVVPRLSSLTRAFFI